MDEMKKDRSLLPPAVRRTPVVARRAKHLIDIPGWQTASRLVFPYLESVSAPVIGAPDRNVARLSDVSARRETDPLSRMLTANIKMSLALLYLGSVIPLSESLLREWSVSIATVLLAMDDNLALVARTCRLRRQETGSGLEYFSLHSDAAPFNSALPFWPPFQDLAARLLGSPFYFAVPERRTVVLFARDLYLGQAERLRNDVLLTYETSTSSLSPEIIEVSESGTLPVMGRYYTF